MVEARWNGALIASSNDTVQVEGNHYFPRAHVNADFLEGSDTSTHCPWKGDASYYNLVVNGETNVDAAWYYAEPKQAAAQIRDHIAFWKGVEILDR